MPHLRRPRPTPLSRAARMLGTARLLPGGGAEFVRRNSSHKEEREQRQEREREGRGARQLLDSLSRRIASENDPRRRELSARRRRPVRPRRVVRGNNVPGLRPRPVL